MRLLVGFLVAACAVQARAAPVTVKLGTLAPAGSAWHDALRQLAQRWDEASGGQVKLKVYPGGVQGNEGEMMRKLSIGQLQAVAVTNLGLHDVIPQPEAFSTPLLFREDAEVRCALDRVRDRLESALEARGLVAVQWGEVGSASFFCTRPFRTPEEMAKAKVFAWEGDPGMVKVWRSAGLQPVVLSSTDLLAALTTGMVDCVSSVPLYMLTTRAFEKARHLIDLPLAPVVGATVVRKEVWERIPAGLRPRLAQIAREEGARIDSEIRRLNADAVVAMKGQGLSVDPVDPAAWRPALERTWATLRGEVVPADFFDALVAARDACRGDHARPGRARRPPPG